MIWEDNFLLQKPKSGEKMQSYIQADIDDID